MTHLKMVVFALALFSSLLSQHSKALSYTQVVTENELQAQLSALMPIEKKHFLATIKLSNPTIQLLENMDKLALSATISVSALGHYQGQGELDIVSGIRYDNGDASFYLVDPQIRRLSVAHLSEHLQPKVKEITQLLLTSVFEKQPVYQLKDDDIKHQLAKSILQTVEIKNQSLQITLGRDL